MSGYVSDIQPGNKALEYIDKRILDDNYRGTESSEHNRYDMQEIYDTLRILNNYAPKFKLIKIRDTDLSKRPKNTPEEKPYALFCDEVKKTVGKGTQDSIRKNIFVDLHRMGLIKRYDKDKNLLSAYDGGSVKYVSLSQDGLNFIKSDLLNRAFIFAKALDKLLGGYIEISLDILRGDDYKIDSITKWEFMFFVSGIDVKYSFKISVSECVDLINEYRCLSPVQKKSVVETLKTELIPSKFSGDKTNKRDWHNWQNKIDQVYHLFKQTPYFDIAGRENEILSLSTKKIRTKKGEIVEIGKRSINEKHAYFKNHEVEKAKGYELHHVVPLSWAESPEQYKLFDKWINMVYIDAFSHEKITQNRNRNILMSANGNDIVLSDDSKNQIYLKDGSNIIYNPAKQPKMLKYNQELRTTTETK